MDFAGVWFGVGDPERQVLPWFMLWTVAGHSTRRVCLLLRGGWLSSISLVTLLH